MHCRMALHEGGALPAHLKMRAIVGSSHVFRDVFLLDPQTSILGLVPAELCTTLCTWAPWLSVYLWSTKVLTGLRSMFLVVWV